MTLTLMDDRLDPKLNQALWARGIKSVPHRLRVKLERMSFIICPDSFFFASAPLASTPLFFAPSFPFGHLTDS